MKSDESLGSKSSKSQRDKAHEELLKAALARPGIRELMKIYGIGQKLNTYYPLTKETPIIVTGNSTSI